MAISWKTAFPVILGTCMLLAIMLSGKSLPEGADAPRGVGTAPEAQTKMSSKVQTKSSQGDEDMIDTMAKTVVSAWQATPSQNDLLHLGKNLVGRSAVETSSVFLGFTEVVKFPTLKEAELRSMLKNLDDLWAPVAELPICKRFAQVCTRQNIPRLRFALLAEAQMYQSMLHVGGPYVAKWVLAFYVIGVCIGPLVVRTQKGVAAESAEQTDSKKPERPRFLDMLAGSLRHENSVATTQAAANQMKNCCDYWSWLACRGMGCLYELLWRPLDYWARWWWLGPEFTHPMASMKLFVALLLMFELNVLMSPEQCILATPELIGLAKRQPWRVPNEEAHDLVPPMGVWLLPGLSEHSQSEWVSYLNDLRRKLLLAWCAFLLLPSHRGPVVQTLNGLCYAYGALVYAYFGTIGLMYNLAHSAQGGILFVTAAIFAVPFLPSNPRAGAWLRKFLLVNTLIPIYLFAGICKLRYCGLRSNITGAWLNPIMKDTHRAIFPKLNALITSSPPVFGMKTPWPCMVLSLGNLAIEVVCPLLALFSTNEGVYSGLLRFLFSLAAVTFHIGVFCTMGPNFGRQIVLLILGSNPLGCFRCKKVPPASEVQGQPTLMDRARGMLAMLVLSGWFAVQLWTDFDHLSGKVPWSAHHNSYFPLPELSMFADGGPNSNYEMTCGMLLVIICGLISKIVGDLDRRSKYEDVKQGV